MELVKPILRVSVAVLILLSHMLSQISCRSLLQTTSEESTSQKGSGSTSHGSSTSGTGSGTSEGSTTSGTNTCSSGEIFKSSELYPHTEDRFALAPMDIKMEAVTVPLIPPCHDPNDEDMGNGDPNRLASCPWDYEVDYDALRIPQKITKARCLCENCGYGNQTTDLLGKACKEITHPVKVWKVPEDEEDSCVNGHQIYQMKTIDVPVSCVCARFV